MNLKDGIYCDASVDDDEGVACIAVVRIQNCDVTDCHRRSILAATAQEAETEAVKLARSLYPGEEIITDNSHVAHVTCSRWLHRSMNKVAHDLAIFRLRQMVRHKKHRGLMLGRGCVPCVE